MKTKYLMLFLISVLIFSLVGCETYEVETIETIEVQYIIIASIGSNSRDYPTVTVSWNNHSQKTTDTIYNLIVKGRLSRVSKDSELNEYLYEEIIATYDNVPKNEPLAIVAMGLNRTDVVGVIIMVDGVSWKDDLCGGEGCGADASGIYDK